MNRRIIWKNLTREKGVSLITILFITTASMLLSLAAILAVSLSGAVDQLMQDAKTPHFMQMHSGTLDEERLRAFSEEDNNVSDFQVMDFLNVENSQIILGKQSLAGSVQDNGLCTQSSRFDLLLDFDNQPVLPKKGELYVPVCYFKDGTVRAGEKASIYGHPFTVAGFVRDSQMNSALASSKRFVVSEEDYALIKPFGSVEYLIEYRLRDMSRLGEFEAAYSAAGLPANGPALTWPLFRMVSAVSDGIMIAVLVLIGILVIFIALFCVRFTLLAKIEDDYREIGTMRAIGMRISDIRGIYLSIYAAMAAVGSIWGFFLALWLQSPLKEDIRLDFGGGESGRSAILLGIVGAGLVFLLILLYVNGSLRRLRKISAVQAIRFGTQGDSIGPAEGIKLSENKVFSANFLLGVHDVLARKRLYVTMLVVIVLASFMMIVPQNLYHTISGEEFVTYIGVGNCDLRLDIQQTDTIEEKIKDIGKFMGSDPQIAKYALFISKLYSVRLDNGGTENLKVELGDHSVFPIQYASGRMPVKENEIALSAINAEELEKGVGEKIILLGPKGERILTVCGIYSDITNGGKTAKAVFGDDSTKASWSVVYADLKDRGQISDEVSQYERQFPYAKISSVDEYMEQTFGQTLKSVRTASFAAVLVAAAVTLLVTLLFMRLLAAKDRYSISVLRAVGFTKTDISHQYAWRAVSVLAVGILAGTILAGTLGEKLSAAAISAFGAATFHFAVDPLNTYLFSPLILLLAALLAVSLGTSHAGNVKLYESIKE